MIPPINILTAAILSLLWISNLSAQEATNQVTNAPDATSEPLPAKLLIDPKGPVKAFAPVFAGLMTEEINHSYDGGLYAELIRNRVFRDNETNAEAWTLTVPSNAVASMGITDHYPLTDKLPKSLNVVISKVDSNQPVTVANEGFWGIPVKPDTTYKVSLYAKGNNPWEKEKGAPDPLIFRGPLTVSIQSADGKTNYASATTPPLNGEWLKAELTLRTGHDVIPSKENQFVISANTPGSFQLNLVSLFPPTYKDRSNGNRPDIMEKLSGLHPKFLRFPGGDYLEGNHAWQRFNWKEARGPLEFRPGHDSRWYYRSSDGLGLLEFMGWCEDLGMEPVLAVYAGYSTRQEVILPGPLLDAYVQDALDEIEYLTGNSKTTYWGTLRAKDGHPEPFKLKYVEIGNEDFFDKSKSYDDRFAQFRDAIKHKYPDLQLIATTPLKDGKPDLLDDHYYKSTEWFVKEFHHYDKADRNGPKIFVGEWATRDNKSANTPTLYEAIGDAAWMCAMERNADLIEMQCYAPLFVNVNKGASQWRPNLIGYDALNSFVSPSWHAQEIFNTHRGSEVLSASVEKEDPANPLPYSVTRDKAKHLIHVKLVNASAFPREVTIDLGKETKVESQAEIITLTSKDPKTANTLQNPDAVKPVNSTIHNASGNFTLKLPPSSLRVISLRTK
jgi:alpha-N-arabinofuranosidase